VTPFPSPPRARRLPCRDQASPSPSNKRPGRCSTGSGLGASGTVARSCWPGCASLAHRGPAPSPARPSLLHCCPRSSSTPHSAPGSLISPPMPSRACSAAYFYFFFSPSSPRVVRALLAFVSSLLPLTPPAGGTHRLISPSSPAGIEQPHHCSSSRWWLSGSWQRKKLARVGAKHLRQSLCQSRTDVGYFPHGAVHSARGHDACAIGPDSVGPELK